MEISQISNLIKAAKAATQEAHHEPPPRRRPAKKTRVPASSVYTPDGTLEEEAGSRLDVVV